MHCSNCFCSEFFDVEKVSVHSRWYMRRLRLLKHVHEILELYELFFLSRNNVKNICCLFLVKSINKCLRINFHVSSKVTDNLRILFFLRPQLPSGSAIFSLGFSFKSFVAFLWFSVSLFTHFLLTTFHLHLTLLFTRSHNYSCVVIFFYNKKQSMNNPKSQIWLFICSDVHLKRRSQSRMKQNEGSQNEGRGTQWNFATFWDWVTTNVPTQNDRLVMGWGHPQMR